jgi:serine/threonine protein kinase
MNAQPQLIGKYQLLKKIATGGMAEVWYARQSGIAGFRKEVVVKRILPHLADDPDFVRMFLNEARMVARFTHPNIAQIFEFGRDDRSGAYFIAMEYVRGEDLGRVMRQAWDREQWLSQALAIRVVAACCDGLHYAHAQADEQGRPLRVVHRDISPQNILLSFDGGVKLVDFGIAKAADQGNHTQSGAIKGKFAYMSPEQASGKPLDNRSDIFALGLVLYELLTNERPFKRDSEIATLSAALECKIDPPSHVAEIPAELDDVVMRALARNPEDRYPDARAFQMALEELLLEMRWVATSVQLSELMRLLFPEREEEDRQLARLGDDQGGPTQGFMAVKSSPSLPAAAAPGAATSVAPLPAGAASHPDETWDAPPGAPPTGSGVRRRTTQSNAPVRERTPSRSGARPAPVPGPAPFADEDEEDALTDMGLPPSGPGRAVRRSVTTSQAGIRPRTSTTSGIRASGRRPTGGAENSSPGRRVVREPPPLAPPPVRSDTPPTVDLPAGEGLPRAVAKAEPARAPVSPVILTVLKGVVALGIVTVLAAAGFRYRDRLAEFLELTLIVDTTQPVEFFVQPAARAGQPPGELRGPFTPEKAPAVVAGDVLLFDDPATGFKFRHEIVPAWPSLEVHVPVNPKLGAVELRVSPDKLADGCRVARVVADGQEVDLGACRKPLLLVEGRHVLAASVQRKRVVFDVDVKGSVKAEPLVDFSRVAD